MNDKEIQMAIDESRDGNFLSHDANLLANIKRIQLEAFKAGMTEATEYIVEDGNPLVAKDRILKARDQKTTL